MVHAITFIGLANETYNARTIVYKENVNVINKVKDTNQIFDHCLGFVYD
jgi:hypothetical protein